MNINTDDCILITNKEYMDLLDPQFEGQTRLDNKGGYYMVFSCDGINYATYNIL